MSDKIFSFNNILKSVVIIGILLVGFSIFYYVVIFIPKRETAKIELSKLEQEAKIEEAKTEQAKQEQITKQQEQEIQNVPEEKPIAPVATKQSSNASARETCFKNADDAYAKALAKENCMKKGYSCSKVTILSITMALQNNRELAKDDCYKKYP